MKPGNVTQITYLFERWRAISTGIMETAQATFLLTIAVKYFELSPLAKAAVVAGGSLGLLSTPLTVWAVSRLRWPVSKAAARIAWAGAACFMTAALFPYRPVYIVCAIGGMTSLLSMVPLLTQMYQANYPDRERGRRYSKTVVIRIFAAASFGWLAGKLLCDLERFPLVLLGFAAAMIFSGMCLKRCPTRPLARESGSHPFRGMRYLKSDPVYRRTLITWMFMGIGNLMMLPMRTDYLANPKYGLDLAPFTISLILVVIPNVSRLVSIVVWGRIFDKMNFFRMRAILNVGFALGTVLFFIGGSSWWLYAAGVVFGLSMAGGDIAWSLWVTKIAPPERVADYMSIHTFLTGLRHAAAPFLAFSLVQVIPIQLLALISIALILTAAGLLVPLFGHDIRSGRAATVIPKEDQE